MWGLFFCPRVDRCDPTGDAILICDRATGIAKIRHMPLLYQFAASPYCEKARWALDYKGVE